MSSGRKDPSLDAKHKAILKKMLQQPENKHCADCLGPSPRWASTNLGVFLCISCSGLHRKIGSHVSKVRSITLDVWTADQITHFTQLGNAKAAEIYEARLPRGFQRPSHGDSTGMEIFIRNKYERQMYIASDHVTADSASAMFNNHSATPQQFHSQHVTSNTRTGALGPRPSIYDMLPRKNAPYDSRGSNRNAHSYSSQFLSGGQSSSSNVRSTRASQMNPVATSLIEMGFPEQLAVEAAGRHRDLQSAADWVLRQKSVRLYSAPAVRQPAPPTAVPPMVNDLMDISSLSQPTSVPPKPSKAVPKAFGTESLLGDTIPKHNVATTPKNTAGDSVDDDDFTDFSAFQSALPTASSTTTTTVLTGSSLNATLAGLYAQGPPKSPTGSTRLPLSPSQLGGRPLVASPVSKSKVGLRNTATDTMFTSRLANTPSTPPPPPAYTESSNVTPPPPPSPLSTGTKYEQKGSIDAVKEQPEQDEDPFAFLSKQALTTASTKRKQSGRTQTSNGTSGSGITFNKDTNERSSSKTTSDLIFEDLLK